VSPTRTIHEGNEVLGRILDAVPGGVVHVGSDGSIRSANVEALRILGLRHDALTQRYITDFDPETIREDGSPYPASEYLVTRVLATGEPQGPTTLGVRRPDGEIYWAVFRAVPVREPDGAVAGAIVTFFDITERKRAEEALRRSEQKWRSLAENYPDFILIVDQDARVLSVNRALAHTTEKQVLGRVLYEYVPDAEQRSEWIRTFNESIATCKPGRLEVRGARSDGTTAWYETIFLPFVEDGDVQRVLVVARDITERRRMLASLAEKERLASVGMLAASVAHEIMNPLTCVLANLEIAVGERGADSERRERAAADAREAARRMQQIVGDLRSLGRAGGDELFYVDVRSVLETALRLSGPAVSRSADIILELDDVPGVIASESRLCQVFINLLMNAAQAIEQRKVGKREIRVRTRHDEAASLVGIEVSDTGCGIPADRLDRIFEAFYTTKPAGTGLGLSISRDIVNRMGGRIDVESVVDEGTTFTVWLSTTRASGSR
jgi:PAS domain S-box-containing protein